MDHFLRSALVTLSDLVDATSVLERGAVPAECLKRLESGYRALRRSAQELELESVFRAARGGETFLGLLRANTLQLEARHLLMLRELNDGLVKMLDRVHTFRTDAACARDASHLTNVMLSSEPMIASQLLRPMTDTRPPPAPHGSD